MSETTSPGPAAVPRAAALLSAGWRLVREHDRYVIEPPPVGLDDRHRGLRYSVVYSEPARSAPVVSVPLAFPIEWAGRVWDRLDLLPPSLTEVRALKEDGPVGAERILAAMTGLPVALIDCLRWTDVEAALGAAVALLPMGFVEEEPITPSGRAEAEDSAAVVATPVPETEAMDAEPGNDEP